MKEIPVIKLNKLKAQPLSKKGVRRYEIKKTPRPYEKYKHKRTEADKKNRPFYKKVLVQCGICVAVCVMAIVMSNINWTPANEAVEGLNMALEHESGWKLFDGFGKSDAVFSKNGNKLIYPVVRLLKLIEESE